VITKLTDVVDTINEMLKGFKRALNTLLKKLSCLMCVSFWLTLFTTFDFPLACLMALIGFLIDNHLLKIRL
jgi:enamine deaminase RidA (YjgF/YER057c/UK114 family)